MKLTRHYPELGYTVVAEAEDYQANFWIYTTFGEAPDLIYEDEDMHDAKSIEDAAVFLHGYVKWDGCSNWHFDSQERAMIHKCSMEGLVNIGVVMATCWEWASELIDHWDR